MNPLRSLTLFLLGLGFCVVPLAAVEIKDGPTTEPAETSAVIRWTTDVECGTSLIFGLAETSLTRRVDGSVGVKHEVRLESLQPGKKYFFQAGTAKKMLTTGSFQTKGAPAVNAEESEKKPGLLKRIFGIKDKDSDQKSPPTPGKAQPAPSAPPKPSAPAAAAGDQANLKSAPPTRETWGDLDTLQDHFIRHGKDFGAKNADDYAAQAWRFLQRAMDEGLPAKLDETDGTIRVWDGRSRSFAAYNRNFTTKTYFRPNSPEYFQRQPGKSVRLRRPDPKS